MSLGYSKEFNDATRPGFDPDAAEAAMRRLKDAQDMQGQQAFQRQLSGAVESTGEIGKAAGTARKIAEETARDGEKERKERTDRAVMLASIDNARDFAAQRGRDAENWEDVFEGRFGDAWREEIANRVMDPDEIPERREGESMEDYRERLGDALIERMIDQQTGQIRPEFRDDPELSEYAEWAHARYEERLAQHFAAVLEDPNSTPEQIANVHDAMENAGINLVRQTAQEAARNDENISEIEHETDVRADETMRLSSAAAENDAFGLG